LAFLNTKAKKKFHFLVWQLTRQEKEKLPVIAIAFVVNESELQTESTGN